MHTMCMIHMLLCLPNVGIATILQHTLSAALNIGVGAGPVGTVLTGPLFFHKDNIYNSYDR